MTDCTDEVALFSHRVDYDHNGILPIGLWEFSYKIDANSVPGHIWDWEGVKFSKGWRANGFSPKTHDTGRDIFAYIPGHLWSPIVSRDQFQGFPPSGVPSKFGVVTES